jgi:SulP family sulfate permease
MDEVPYIDQSGLYALEEAILDLQRDNIVVVFAALQIQPHDMLTSIGVIPILVPEMHVFDSFSDCEVWLKQNLSSDKDGILQIAEELLKVKIAKVAYRM